jgi:uncharacterized membrane protein
MTDATSTPVAAPVAATPIKSATMDMLRSVLMGVGTPLLARGLVNGDQLGAIIGGLLAIASALWSYIAAHPSKVSALVSLLNLVRAGGNQRAWNGDVAVLVPLLLPTIESVVDAQIKAKAGILAGPLDAAANAAIRAEAAKAEAAVEA